ncbi:MAG: tandem-95 repeat protein, partial [Pseudomonadota bacterium]|nr:tandem-95 repeat protein [Pseudomonadota bacterium]
MAVIVISGVDVNLVTDNLSTIVLFPSVLVESDDASAVLTATLTASDATNGGFTADSLLASGFTDLGDGTYTYSGTAAEMTAALQLLVFEPAADSTASGASAAIAYTIDVTEPAGGSASSSVDITIEVADGPGVPTPDQYDTVIYGDAGDNPLVGTSGNDWIEGGAGRDNIDAGAGDDYIIAGAGGDWWVKGGSGADIFQFSVGDFGVKIADWEDGVDKIFLAGGLTYADLEKLTYTGTGLTTVVYRTSNGDRLMFYNMDPTLIDEDDFLTEADFLDANTAPVAVADAPSGNEDTVISGVVTATDADGDTVTFSLAFGPSNGEASVDASGSYTYTPSANFNGTDSFDVLADDGNGGTDTVTVTVTVNGVNDGPVAVDDSAASGEGASVVISLLANDSDADGDALSLSAIGAAGNGTVVDNGDGTVTYTPTSGFSGTDSFSYTVSDGNGGTATATATVTVSAAPVNTAPVAVDDSAAT